MKGFFALVAALLAVPTGAALADSPSDYGYGPINTSDHDVKLACQETHLALVGPRFENMPDSRENRTTNGVRVKTDSGLYLSMPAFKDEQTDFYPALKVGQRVQACLITFSLTRRGGESNRYCVNTSYRFYNYDLERVYWFGNNGCHA